jgi:hypothetical protein
MQSGDWRVLRFPALAEQDERHVIYSLGKTRIITRKAGEALHPQREPIETLNAIRELQGEYHFAGQYQQTPAPLAGGFVKREWFVSYAPHARPQKFELIFQSWDPQIRPGRSTITAFARLGAWLRNTTSICWTFSAPGWNTRS